MRWVRLSPRMILYSSKFTPGGGTVPSPFAVQVGRWQRLISSTEARQNSTQQLVKQGKESAHERETGGIGDAEGGATSVMRTEHRQIGQHLEVIHQKVAEQNPDSDQEEQALLNLLGSHNMKEERVLYPGIDRVTSAEARETVFRKI